MSFIAVAGGVLCESLRVLLSWQCKEASKHGCGTLPEPPMVASGCQLTAAVARLPLKLPRCYC